MIYRIARWWASAPPAGEAGSDPLHPSSLLRTNGLEMLAAASQGVGECPAWVIMELEAGEKAEREPAYGEERKGS